MSETFVTAPLPTLCLGITPGGAWKIIWNVRDGIQVGYMQGVWPAHHTIFWALIFACALSSVHCLRLGTFSCQLLGYVH